MIKEATTPIKEFSLKAVVLGAFLGVLYAMANVYLSLKAGLSVSASIPIAVLAITIGKKYLHTTILENNIIQTTGSAGESIGAGVVFTLPAFLFLSDANSATLFNYFTILTLAIIGGLLGTLFMVPLRRSLIVEEHDTLPYPEGTACAAVLKAGEKGGDFAQKAFKGMGIAFVYALLQKVFGIIAEVPTFMTKASFRFFPSAKVSGEITPEYMGVGYIIGFRLCAILVAGSALASFGLTPLLSSIVSPVVIANQLVKLGYLSNLQQNGGVGGWDPLSQQFTDNATAIYFAFIRQIGAGAVTLGGMVTLLRSVPTIIKSFQSSIYAWKDRKVKSQKNIIIKPQERDIPFIFVGLGCLLLIFLITLIPMLSGDSFIQKITIALLVIIFGIFFVTVGSRIVGLVGSSNSPVSGIAIATIMGTSLLFIAVGWTGKLYEPMALTVGGIICIAVANAGATSQDLKTGFLVGATPIYQQIALFVGVITSSIMIGIIIMLLDTPTPTMLAQGIHHAIGTQLYPAPQATLMATLIKGVLSYNLDWHFILSGIFIGIVFELCGVNSLVVAIGLYLPLSTTLPIFAGGLIKKMIEWREHVHKQNEASLNVPINTAKEDLSHGNLFSTGLIAGGGSIRRTHCRTLYSPIT